MSDGLVIGTQGISHRDDMVLRALVRLLDGGINISARFSEQLEECNVVFVPGNWPYRFHAPCITVGVKDPAMPDQSPDSACDLAVSTPLRMTNVIAVLQSATQRLHNVSQFDPVKGLVRCSSCSANGSAPPNAAARWCPWVLGSRSWSTPSSNWCTPPCPWMCCSRAPTRWARPTA